MPNVAAPMLCFLVGLVSCGISMVFAYVTQLRLLNELHKSGQLATLHVWTLWAAIFGFVISLGSFSYGAWLAVYVFQGHVSL
jgi:hypothetical protein